MKRFSISLLSLLIAGAAHSQSGRPAPLESPEVHPDRSVTFRLRAPDAEKVELSGQFQSANEAMHKDADGVWSVTVGPIEPNLYPYNFVVDGIGLADPANQDIFPNEGFKASLVDVPGDTPASYAIQDVPHGDVAYCYYESKTVGGTRPLLVYTPPGYHDSDSNFPVFYLVSGTTDTEETWFKVGKVNFMLDNLIAQGKAEPMIVVMPYGNMGVGMPRPSSPEVANMYRMFADELTGSILPFVELRFRVRPERESRAIAGFSRGGGQSLFTGFSHLDAFAYIGSYSAYLTPEVFETHFKPLAEQPESLNEQLKLLWLGVGKTDFLYQEAIAFNEYLSDRGIDHTALITEGGHTWMNARHYLEDTLQRFFK